MMRKLSTCDYGHETYGKVRRLSTGGNAGVRLCREHWEKEMSWRRMRNKALAPGNKFPIRKFPA